MCNNRIISNSFNNNANSYDDRLLSTSNYRLPTNLRYGNAYVPIQTLRNVYSPAEGLAYGTMFPELVSSYCPDQSLSEMNYLRNYNERGCGM